VTARKKVYAMLGVNLDWAKAEQVKEEHFAYLDDLQERGDLMTAGLYADGSGGMFLVRAASLAEARGIAEQEPYCRHGVRRYDVKELDLTRLFSFKLQRSPS
jgi:uncharacterized protein YciI